MKRFLYVFLGSILLTCNFYQINLYAQKPLKLKDALDIALAESFDVKQAKLSLESTEKSLEAIQLGIRTSLNFELSPGYTNSLNSIYNTNSKTEEYYHIGKTSLDSRFRFNQPIVFTNGQLSIIGSLVGRSQFNTGASTNRDYYSNLSFNFRQPLFKYNNQKAVLEKAEINLEKAKYNYSKNEADIIYDVTANYYHLLQAKKSLEIKQIELDQKQTSYETAINKFKAGLIAEVEALQLEVELASSKNDLLNASRTYDEMKDNFKILLGIDLKDKIDIEDNIEYEPIKIERDSAVQLALNNRPELLNSKSDITIAEMGLEETKYANNITADLEINYGINKVDNKINNVFRNFLDDRAVNLTVNIPVWEWGKTARQVESQDATIQISKLALENQEKSIKNEINQLINKIESSKERIEILKKSIELADKSYNISLERFKSGNITSFELTQMQLKFTNTKMDILNALIEYKIAIADLERKTCTHL
jgi:outer membrane protein TolC